MRDWNVVATTRDEAFRRGCELLSNAGRLWHTEFYNVVVLKVEDVDALLGWLEREWSAHEGFHEAVAHVRPLRVTFDFQSPEAFEQKAAELALGFAPELRGKSFHVRMHRRGFKGRLSTGEEERRLGDALLERLSADGAPGRVTFEDPDAVLAVETVGTRGGMALWSRDELRRYLFLGLD